MLTPERRSQMDAIVGQTVVKKPTSVLTPERRAQMDAVMGNNQTIKKPFISKVGDVAMDVLNTPSYLIGGAIKGGRENGIGGVFGGATSAVKQGFTGDYAPTVYEQLPKAFGLEEGSLASTLVGLGGEILTPNIPVAKILGMGGKALGIGKIAGKTADIASDASRTLLEKSYKLNASNIDKIAESIGVTKPAEKAVKVIDYLESLGLKGATRESLKTLEKKTEPVQKMFDRLTKTGKNISRQPYIDSLLQEAIKAEKIDTPESRILAKKLLDEAAIQESKLGRPMTDTELSERVSRLFKESGASALADPMSSSFSKRQAIAGQTAREIIAPKSRELGRKLKGLITAGEVVGKQANTGLGTQLVNAFKPSALGFGIGAGVGASRGENPIASGLIGSGIGIAANNPRVLNLLGKGIGYKIPKASQKTKKVLQKIFDTAIRYPVFTTRNQSEKRQ